MEGTGIVRPAINAAPTGREINDRIEARSSNGPVTVVVPSIYSSAPCVTATTLPTLQSSSVFRPELNAPQSDRFVRNRDASLSEQLFDVSKAHAESVVEPDGVADDFRWKSIAAVAWRIGLHWTILSVTSSI